MSWTDAWRQAEHELGPASGEGPVPIYPKWPFVLLALSMGVSAVMLPILMVLAFLLVGFATTSGTNSGGEDALINSLSMVFLVSWVGIPVSLIAVALKSARTEKAAAAAWIGALVWLAVSVWFYFTSV